MKIHFVQSQHYETGTHKGIDPNHRPQNNPAGREAAKLAASRFEIVSAGHSHYQTEYPF